MNMGSYSTNYTAQFNPAEWDELRKAYGNGPSTTKERAIEQMTKALKNLEIHEKIESLKAATHDKIESLEAEVIRLNGICSQLHGIADEKRLGDEKIADLEEQLKDAKKCIKHQDKQHQLKGPKRRRESNLTTIPSECFTVENDPVEPDLFDFDIEQIIVENSTPLASVSSLIRMTIDRCPKDMSFVCILEQNYPRMLKSMTDLLICFAFTQRGVILRIKNSRYLPFLVNFQLDFCCLFCQEKQYHIRMRNKDFYFKYASPDNERHECRVSLIKQYLQRRNPSAKGENKVSLIKGVGSLGSDISAIIAYLLFVGKDFTLRRLYGALLSVLILVNERKKAHANRNGFCENDLKIDCMAIFEEWLDTRNIHSRLFEKNDIFTRVGSCGVEEWVSFKKKWELRCGKTISRAFQDNSLNWQTSRRSAIPPTVTAIANFLLRKTKDSFLVGAYNMSRSSKLLFGNVDPRDSSAVPCDATDNGSPVDTCGNDDAEPLDDRDIDGRGNDDTEPLDDLDIDGRVNEFISEKDFRGWNVTMSKETLMRLGKAPISKIPFVEDEMAKIIKNVSQINCLSSTDSSTGERVCTLDTLFWCPDIRNSGIEEKFIENTFIDGTFLKGKFGTLLTICGITIDNRVLPLAHMLHEGSENKSHSILFLTLVKKYVPLDWKKTIIMSDQSKSFEGASQAVFKRALHTCSVHLLRNIIRNCSGNVTALFHEMLHTLDPEKRKLAKRQLLKQFHPSAAKRSHPTFNKVSENPRLFCRSLRKDGFEQFTTNPVEQFHSTIKQLKDGCVVNLVSQLSMLQLSAFNRLSVENNLEYPKMSGFGSVVISLNIALALTMKIQRHGRTFSVFHDPETSVPLKDIYSGYMRRLGRRENYTLCRTSYIESLTNCIATKVTEISCSLCNQQLFYCYCPHILAVRLRVSFEDLWHAARMNEWDCIDQVEPLLNRITFPELVQLVGCHSSLYRGELEGKQVILFEDCIYEPGAINRWSGETAQYLMKHYNSSQYYNTVGIFTGRRLNFMDRNIRRERTLVKRRKNFGRFHPYLPS